MPRKSTKELIDQVTVSVPSGIPSGVVAKPLRESLINIIESFPNLDDAPKAEENHTHPISDIEGLQIDLDGKQDRIEQGRPNGYPNLDATGRVPLSQLPDDIGGGGGSTILDPLAVLGNPTVATQAGISLPAPANLQPPNAQSLSLVTGFNADPITLAVRKIEFARVFYYGRFVANGSRSRFTFVHDLQTQYLQVEVYLHDSPAVGQVKKIEVDMVMDSLSSFYLDYGVAPPPGQEFAIFVVGVQGMQFVSQGIPTPYAPYFNSPT